MRTRDDAHVAHSTSGGRYGDPSRTALNNRAMSIRSTVLKGLSVELPSYTSVWEECIRVSGNTSDGSPDINSGELESDLTSLKPDHADLLY